MSKKTKIQWCDGTVNPVMGCDGCELWPTIGQLTKVMKEHINQIPNTDTKVVVNQGSNEKKEENQ
jgi:hypothetical protein